MPTVTGGAPGAIPPCQAGSPHPPPPSGIGTSESGPEPPHACICPWQKPHERCGAKTQDHALPWRPSLTLQSRPSRQPRRGTGPPQKQPTPHRTALRAAPNRTKLDTHRSGSSLRGKKSPPGAGCTHPPPHPGEGPARRRRLLSEAFTAAVEKHTCPASPDACPERQGGRPRARGCALTPLQPWTVLPLALAELPGQQTGSQGSQQGLQGPRASSKDTWWVKQCPQNDLLKS